MNNRYYRYTAQLHICPWRILFHAYKFYRNLWASSTWASCGPSLYPLEPGTLVNSLEITNCDMSILLHNTSDIVCLAYSAAALTEINSIYVAE